jgi:hypothetical protein
MAKPLQYIGQGLFYALFMGVIGYFSTSPAYTHLPPEEALIKLSFSHAGHPKGACRERTPEELAKLPMYQRKVTTICPRERENVVVELEMDGKQLYHVELKPGGLLHSSISSIYRRIPVKAGNHTLKARLNDNGGDHFNYVHEEKVDLAPGRIMLIDFQEGTGGGFIFKNHNAT